MFAQQNRFSVIVVGRQCVVRSDRVQEPLTQEDGDGATAQVVLGVVQHAFGVEDTVVLFQVERFFEKIDSTKFELIQI